MPKLSIADISCHVVFTWPLPTFNDREGHFWAYPQFLPSFFTLPTSTSKGHLTIVETDLRHYRRITIEFGQIFD